jgi:CelD/BcsL family acetyltransferase involved in cellulose biosynthesis
MLIVRVHSSWEEARGLLSEWDALGKQLGSCIYLSPTHSEIWWKHYGRGRLLIVECRREGKLVGVLPMFIATIVAGIVPIAVARLLTSEGTITVMSPPVEPGDAQVCWAAGLKAVCEAGADVIAIGPLSGEDGNADALRAALQGAGLVVVRDRSSVVHTVFNLPDSMEDYYAGLSSKARANFKSGRRQFEKAGSWEIRVASTSDASDFFERFVSFHTERWCAIGLPGHFGDWPGSTAYNSDLVRAHAPREEAFLFEVFIDGKCVAAEFAFNYGLRNFSRLPARMTGEKWDKANLGGVIQIVTVELLLERGIRRIESGPGHYSHKLRAGGHEFPLVQLLARRSGAVCSLKARLLVAWSNLWHYGYYRGWRARLLPRLGLMPGPLWRPWIRTRL